MAQTEAVIWIALSTNCAISSKSFSTRPRLHETKERKTRKEGARASGERRRGEGEKKRGRKGRGREEMRRQDEAWNNKRQDKVVRSCTVQAGAAGASMQHRGWATRAQQEVHVCVCRESESEQDDDGRSWHNGPHE